VKKLITAALLIVLGAAQAMPVTKPAAPDTASAVIQTKSTDRSLIDMDFDDDEAAPPVHIHHATASSKKPAKKSLIKKVDASGKKGAAPLRRVKSAPTPASQ